MNRALGVHRVGGPGVEVPHGVVRDRGKVDDRVDVAQVRRHGVADVPHPLLVPVDLRPEVAPLVPVAVQPDDGVPGRLEHGHEDRSDVTAIAGDEAAHQRNPSAAASAEVRTRCRLDPCPRPPTVFCADQLAMTPPRDAGA